MSPASVLVALPQKASTTKNVPPDAGNSITSFSDNPAHSLNTLTEEELACARVRRPPSETNSATASSSKSVSFPQKPHSKSLNTTTSTPRTTTNLGGSHASLADALMTSISHNNLSENVYHGFSPSLSKTNGMKRSRTYGAGHGRVKRLRRNSEVEEEYAPGSWVLSKVPNSIPIPVIASAEGNNLVQEEEQQDSDADNEADLIRLFVASRDGQVSLPPSSNQSESPTTQLTDALLSIRNLNTRFIRGKNEALSSSGAKPHSDGIDVRMDVVEAEATTIGDEAQRTVDGGGNSTAMLDHNTTFSKPKAKIPVRPRQGWIFAALDENIHRKRKRGQQPSSNFYPFPTPPRIRLGCFIPREDISLATESIDGRDPDLLDHKQNDFELNVNGSQPPGGDISLSGSLVSDLDLHSDADVSSQVEIAVLDDKDDDDVPSEIDLPIDQLAEDDDAHQEEKAHAEEDVSSSISMALPTAPHKHSKSKPSVEPQIPTSSEPRRSPRKVAHTIITLTNPPRQVSNRTAATNLKRKASTSKIASTTKEVDHQEKKKPASDKRKGKAKEVEDREKITASSSSVSPLTAVDKDSNLNSNAIGTESISSALNNSFSAHTKRESYAVKSKSAAAKATHIEAAATTSSSLFAPSASTGVVTTPEVLSAPASGGGVSSTRRKRSKISRKSGKNPSTADNTTPVSKPASSASTSTTTTARSGRSANKTSGNGASNTAGTSSSIPPDVPSNEPSRSGALNSIASSNNSTTISPAGTYNPYSHLTHMTLSAPTAPPPAVPQIASQAVTQQPNLDPATNIQIVRDYLPSIQALPLQLQTYLLTALATGIPGILPPALGNVPAMQAGVGNIGNVGNVGNVPVNQNPGVAPIGNGFGTPGPLLPHSSSSSAPMVQPLSNNVYVPFSVASIPPMPAPPAHSVLQPQYTASAYPVSSAVPYTSTPSLAVYSSGSTAENYSGVPSSSQPQTSSSTISSSNEMMGNGNEHFNIEPMRVGPPRKRIKKYAGKGKKDEKNIPESFISTPAAASTSSSVSQPVQTVSESGANHNKGPVNEAHNGTVIGVMDADGEIDLNIYAPYYMDINQPTFGLM
ncbi:hypothetical protein J3R30DRAFT_3681823 [Lentinula aciculospora]|uniref:Uncharacterized protein n=1 Tax=Lentinula aciculospora TaxID=153920 RepID=A0A9W9AEW5_9AGAR|nr:hypothetical protein J3R30DRAFT_3681823 [Lentinula aciculospora]